MRISPAGHRALSRSPGETIGDFKQVLFHTRRSLISVGTDAVGGAASPVGRRADARSSPLVQRELLEIHIAHAATGHGGGSRLRLVRDHCLGGDEQSGDRGRTLQCQPDELGGVDFGLHHPYFRELSLLADE